MGIWYTSREEVKSALDSAETARNNTQVDRAIESASRSVEGLLRRRFYPETGTRYFDWPNYQYAAPWRLWLGRDELISVTTLVAGGVTISSGDFHLEPVNSGPPFTRLEILRSSSSSFGTGPTPQRDIAITGVFGYRADTTPAGALAEALDDSETTVDVSDSSLVDVGHIVIVDDERMIVTGRSMLDTGQDIGADLTASVGDVTLSVADGTALSVGEIVLVDSERMLVVDIAGNNATVKRAWDGSVLAAHSFGADVYAPRTLTVERGALGTAAASHTDATAITRHVVPGLVRELCVAEAINTLQQETSSYGRTIGEGENEREASGRGLRDIRSDALAAYGRRARNRAV